MDIWNFGSVNKIIGLLNEKKNRIYWYIEIPGKESSIKKFRNNEAS